MTTIRDEIAKNLLFYRKKMGLTQKELADKLGVKNTAVSNWEKGNNSIDIDTLFLACEIFNITLNDMYGKYSSHEDVPCLSPDEQRLLDAFRTADPLDQELVRRALHIDQLQTEEQENAG